LFSNFLVNKNVKQQNDVSYLKS